MGVGMRVLLVCVRLVVCKCRRLRVNVHRMVRWCAFRRKVLSMIVFAFWGLQVFGFCKIFVLNFSLYTNYKF